MSFNLTKNILFVKLIRPHSKKKTTFVNFSFHNRWSMQYSILFSICSSVISDHSISTEPHIKQYHQTKLILFSCCYYYPYHTEYVWCTRLAFSRVIPRRFDYSSDIEWSEITELQIEKRIEYCIDHLL